MGNIGLSRTGFTKDWVYQRLSYPELTLSGTESSGSAFPHGLNITMHDVGASDGKREQKG
ncbi:hypothetical protein PBNK5_18010 [Pectobacterium brasiliense]